MRATNYHQNWSQKVTPKVRLHPVLIILAVLFLFCLPLNQIALPISGIRHPAVAFSFLMVVAMICVGIRQIARQEQLSLTPLTYWLFLCFTFSVIPAFYLHADLYQAILHVTGITLSLLLFITLQQFSFNYHQRQYLLWFPMLSGWLIALTWTLAGLQKIDLLNWKPFAIAPNTSAIILLTSLVLSAYLLARTHIYKRTLTFIHILLVTTPLVTILALMALPQPQILSVTILLVILPQLFMFKFCQKIHHLLWNIGVILGFLLANYVGWIQNDMLFFSNFSAEKSAVLNQTIGLLKTVKFEGVGIGQLATAQLLFGLTQENIQPMLLPFPSWLLGKLTEGGLATWVSFLMLGWVFIKRLLNAPNGTRLMLSAISFPTLYGICTTEFIELNPILILFFIIQLYWIDNLTTQYHRIQIQPVRYLTPLATSLFISTSAVVFSSVYLGEQAQNAATLSDQTMREYQHHPWWNSFYRDMREKHLFLQSVEKNDKQAQEIYLRKQVITLTKKPTPDNYSSLIDAATLANHQEITHQLQIEANLLFPARFAKPSAASDESFVISD